MFDFIDAFNKLIVLGVFRYTLSWRYTQMKNQGIQVQWEWCPFNVTIACWLASSEIVYEERK